MDEADCAAWAEVNLFDRRWHYSWGDLHTCAVVSGSATCWGTLLRVSGECGACGSCRGRSPRSEVKPSHTHSLCKKHRTIKRKFIISLTLLHHAQWQWIHTSTINASSENVIKIITNNYTDREWVRKQDIKAQTRSPSVTSGGLVFLAPTPQQKKFQLGQRE